MTRMTVTPEDYDHLLAVVRTLPAWDRMSFAASRQQYADEGLSEMRFRWDVYWCALKHARDTSQSAPLTARHYTDNHIDTALRRMIAALAAENPGSVDLQQLATK